MRAYLPLARSLVPSFVRSFFPPRNRESTLHRPASLPARGGKAVAQWQLYHVTSTLPHLKKANCIERRRRCRRHRRHRRHRHPSPACSAEASFGSRLSASPATLDECTFHWWHGARARGAAAAAAEAAAAETEAVAQAAPEPQSTFIQPAAEQPGRKFNCRLATRCAINDDSEFRCWRDGRRAAATDD